MRVFPLSLLLAAIQAGPALAQTPQATSAVYGNWTLSCESRETGKVCQVVTRLNVQGQDGQNRPLLALALLSGEAGQGLRLEVPPGVDLRLAARLDGSGVVDQDPLAVFSYLTCLPNVCIAETLTPEPLLSEMLAAEAIDISFTLFEGSQAVRVPVSLQGFADAVAAMD